MNFRTLISTLWFLQSRSLANSLLARVRRLKQPKYLIGAVIGAGYLWLVGFRHLFTSGGNRAAGGGEAMPAETQLLFESGAAAALLCFTVLMWVFAGDRASLRFTEAEVAFLFPAPLSRRSLVHFQLLRSQLGILFTAVFFSFFTGRAARDGHWLIHIFSWWLVLSALNLHGLAASFAVQRLTERGLAGWRRRLAMLTVVAAFGGVIAWWVRSAPAAAGIRDFEDFREFAVSLVSAGPAPWLLAPFRWLVRPWFARDAVELLGALWPALLVLAAHYVWVVRADVAFEEASIDASRKFAEKLAAIRSGEGLGANKPKKAKRAPFSLAPTGFAPAALLWKNLLGAGRLFTLRSAFLLGWIALVGSFAVSGLSRGDVDAQDFRLHIAAFCLAAIGLTTLLAPQILRNDFRSDLPNLDMLKTLPLPAWQIVLGELLAPAAILTGVQWLLLVLALGLSSGIAESDGPELLAWRWPLALALALVLPVFGFLLLTLPNAAVLLFPAWAQNPHGRGGGIEVMGQRLVFVFGQVAVLLLALLPGGLAGAGLWWLAQLAVGAAWAVPVAALGVALVLAAEAAAAVWGLGKLFARLDMSAEQ